MEKKMNNNVIKKDMLFLDDQSDSKSLVLHKLVNAAKLNNLILDEQEFLNSVIERENEISTAIGYKIAMPHGKSQSVISPFIAFMKTTSEFVWSQENDEKVKLIFLIGVPKLGTDKLHLKFISELSKKLLDDEFRNELENSSDVERVYKLLNNIKF